ncbi:MAG: nicotinate (nicotinamide) nucleotide adenylyltransferase [Epulopiscium sp. Nele67-Bin005]|nr:MAG: nicotinate (nicotinamide) nucleotide adenylyltransferase [Epulopiscium sp. Nele67-Bin005]
MNKRLAIMGGTFDPIHMGHLVTAEAVYNKFRVDEVLFVPTGSPAHKQNQEVTSKLHRFIMVELAISDNPNFRASKMEIDREGITYTIDTIKALKQLYGADTEIFFITGADAIGSILKWKDAEELFKLCCFVAVTRPDYNTCALLDQVKMLQKNYEANIQFLEVPSFAISSSDIRTRVQNKISVQYLVPKSVENYIKKYQLYEGATMLDKETMIKMDNYVKEKLSPKRYFHTKGVVQMGLELALVHKIDSDKVFIGTLFHDIAKELSSETMLELGTKYNVEWDSFEQQHHHLKHGKMGGALLKEQWGISDEEILNSIRYHTIGREQMTDVEKIVYLADFLEHGRGHSEELEMLRAVCLQDLNRGMYEVVRTSKHFVTVIKNQAMHPITDKLLEEYEIYRKPKI